jgi:hypothetical protein
MPSLVYLKVKSIKTICGVVGISVEKNKWGIIFSNHPQLGLSGNITVNHGLAK